jgi:protein-L-isoaspartate(D-aspartate) O-methyltransferase
MIHFEQKRKNMIARLSDMGITDKSVLNAMSKVPREYFIAHGLEHQAYEEKALPIGFNQTISHPYTVAKMTELLQIKPGNKILEIGTGSGYQAAVLCALKVTLYTVEIETELAQKAKKKLNSLGFSFISKTGDGSLGWKAYAPYDGIIVTAGVPSIANELFEQLKNGGRLIIPVGNKNKQILTVYEKYEEEISKQQIEKVLFVPMTGKKGLETN